MFLVGYFDMSFTFMDNCSCSLWIECILIFEVYVVSDAGEHAVNICAFLWTSDAAYG